MRNTFLPLALLTLLVLSSCSTNDCSEERIEYIFNFTQEKLKSNPYTGYDTLYFLNKEGDTCIVRGTGKQFYYDIEPIPGNPDCAINEYRYYQAYKIDYMSVKGNLSFEMIHKWDSHIEFWIGGWGLYRVSPFIHIYGWTNRIGQISINNKMYDGVIQAYVEKTILDSDKDTIYKVLINQSHGVLLLANGNTNEEYTILPKL